MANKYDEIRSQLAQQSSNPAAAAGMQQMASGAASAPGGPKSPVDYITEAQSWFTGRNTVDETSGWSTEFQDEFQSGWSQALQDGTARNYFDTGTGVVLWDHTTDQGNRYQFGDVVERGKKTGNVYDDYGREVGNLMLLPWIADGKQQERLFDDGGDVEKSKWAVDEFVSEVRESNNANMGKAFSAAAFAGEVTDTQAAIQDAAGGAGDELLAGGGGAVGGAITGAGAGAALTAWLGPGAAAGAIVGGAAGAVIGGVGGLLNKDEISEAAARAYEITEVSFEQNNTLAGLFTAGQQAAGLSMKFTSPLQNLTHGVVDWREGDVGDGVSERYAVDDTGRSTASTISKVASWTALVGDSLLQFAGPLNRTVYTAQMGTSIAGEVGTMTFTGGEMFDPREGGYDNIFVNDDGGFDPVSAAAGILKVGIDAVQLMGVRGLAAQAEAGRAAAEAGEQVVDLGGRKFVLNEAGQAVSHKNTIALLAPSEQLAWQSATRQARVAAMKEGRAVSSDDLFRASYNLANGSNRLKAAVVNSFGEAYEEGVQALLEPVALDGELSFGKVASAAASGLASGLGMGLGATLRGTTRDERMMLTAFTNEAWRTGVEPDFEAFAEEWAGLTDTEKRTRAARSKLDSQVTQAALDQIVRDQSATLVAGEAAVLKAVDARRTKFERELKSASVRTDAYHMLAGQLSAGRVSVTGAPVGDTAPAEAVEASAKTIHELLSNRYRGLELQRDTITAELASLDPADEKAVELKARSEFLELTLAVGEGILADVEQIVTGIYEADAGTAQQMTRQLNRFLEGAFRTRLTLNAPEGSTATAEQLALAGAHFVTLMSSREPKLDAGSYVALLPRASWELTRTGGDNLVQVNTDILASINGDFDGDRLRAENQISVSPERFLQIRSGQTLGGAGRSIDIAERNFDAPLAKAVAEGLLGEVALHDEAEAVLSAIDRALTLRYGDVVSPVVLARAMKDFRTAVLAGSGEARKTLVDSLARQAGEAIVEVGKQQLTNEWLWISKVVLANFEAYQDTYRRVRSGSGPSPLADVPDIDTPEGTNRRKDRAVNDAQTLALFAPGNNLFRKFQKIHYTWFNSSVVGALETEQHDLLPAARFYEELANNVTRAEALRAVSDDTVAGRVLVMLDRIVDAALRDPDSGLAGLNPAAALTVLANVKVHDVEMVGGVPTITGRDMSLVQVLLKRALDAEREEHAKTFDLDEKLKQKHSRLRAMTVPNSVNGDVNAERAFLEVFKAVPFADSLGGITGALEPHTTPEQWLSVYRSMNENDRQHHELYFTKGVPEYLERKSTLNLPYSMDEMARREVTPYRAMLDAMMAVGRHELTFDPDKPPAEAFKGTLAQVSQRAADDFRAGHELLHSALQTYRKTRGRRAVKRLSDTELVQEMLEANPQVAKAVLDLVPDAAANALFEFRDGQLFIEPWLYQMFAIENREEALFYFWKNLTLTQWSATLMKVRESDADALGRQYGALSSRFQRLLYTLAQEPGQHQLELVLRRMHTSNNLDEFFHWLNSEPGLRTREAVYLPFNDDVAEFEADTGGWATIKPGSDLRTALTALRRQAGMLQQTLAFREVKAGTDRLILDGIKLALAGDPAATPEHKENLRKLRRAVAISHDLPRGFAPGAMLALTQGALRGFDAHSHDKGQVPTTYEALGEFQALMDAFAFVPGLERVMEVLTAHSMDSLRTNLGDIAKHSGVAMDANGRQIEWARLTVEQAVEMLDNSDTAPLALALLTPSALDTTQTGLTEKLLMEASLKDLLDEDHYKELYAENPESELDQAMRYLSLVDSKARAEGGSFDAMRAANDLAISRLSGLGRPATEDDLQRLRNFAYIEVARTLKLVGQIQATPETTDVLLLELRDAAKKTLRDQHLARALPAFTDDTGQVVEESVESLLQDLEDERVELLSRLAELYEGSELAARTDTLNAQYERNAQRLRGMLDDNLSLTMLDRFRLTGDDVADEAPRARIVEYVRSMTSFPMRSPEAAEAWAKLAGQLQAGSSVKLSASDWDSLSRAAMGVAMTDQLLAVASHVSIPPFPKGDPAVSDARFFKYYDPTFSFLATDLLDPAAPLSRAAAWLHTAAGQPRTILDIDSATKVLRNSLLNRDQLGTWTPGLMAQLVATNERMDSAGAPPGIAAAGNGPKRQAAIAAATRRSGAVPDASLLTTVTLTADLLAADATGYDLIDVHPAGTPAPTTMPVAQLENRFYASITIDGVPLPLDRGIGFEWDGADEANPYRYVSIERLRPVLERYAAAAAKPLSQVQVEATFFHPDSQPEGMWNNAFFEGMTHSLLPDGSESLIATLWADNGGRISADTQWTIDSGKKGLRAIQPFRRPDAAELAEIDALWERDRDLAAMLRRKTQLAMTYDDGSGPLDPSFYNAVYKHMKLAHIVVGRDDAGKPVALTAEQVIAGQAQSLTDPKLVRLSPDVLRSMLGDTGDQAARRFFPDEILLNPDRVPSYQGITAEMVERFGEGWLAESGTPADTTLARVGAQRALTVRTQLTPAERNARQERIVYLNNAAAEERAARSRFLDKTATRNGYVSVLRASRQAVGAERSTFDFGPYLAPRGILEAEHTDTLLAAYHKLEDGNSFHRGWMIVDEGSPDYPSGTLTVDSLNADRKPGDRIVKDDIALVRLDSFEKQGRTDEVVTDRVEKALRYLANSGATVVLGSGNAGGDLRFDASLYLRSLGYAPVAGSKHVYAPVEFVFQTQNERAYASTLLETKNIRPAKNIITFLSIDPVGTDENLAVLNPKSWKLRDRKLVNNLLPSSMVRHFNVPVDTGRSGSQLYGRVLTHLRTHLDPGNTESRKELLKQAGPDRAGEMPLARALDRLHSKIVNTGSLEPRVGEKIEVGDIIPFVHADGRVLLYRHGFKLPRPQEMAKAFTDGTLNIVVSTPERDADLTTNTGYIREVEHRASYGRNLVLEVELQPYGDKVQLEWNGMKYVLVPPKEGTVLPPVFGNGTVVDLLSDVASADAKEALEGRVRGYRNALAFFQFDFLDDMVEFFYPGEEVTNERRVLVKSLLHRLATQHEGRIPFVDANAIAKANVAVADLLGDFAELEATRSGLPTDWTQRLTQGGTATSQIAHAMITYLLTPGADVDNVLRSAGFSHSQAGDEVVQTRLVPGLFADLLDNGLDSPLHEELIRRFDAQLYRGPNGEGFKLHSNWTVEMFDGKGGSTLGYLQFGEAHPSGDNPELNGQTFNPNERSGVSSHNALAANLAVGAATAHRELVETKAFSRAFSRGGGIPKLASGDSVWSMLTALPAKDTSFTGWRRETPAEMLRRDAARPEIVGFFQELNTSDEAGWTAQQRRDYERGKEQILGMLNLYGQQTAMVDTWVRQHLGRPHGMDENGNELGLISGADALEMLSEIRRNINAHLLPTAGANVPLMDLNHLTTIYMENLNRENGWAPVDPGTEAAANSWDSWVEMAFGTAWIVGEGQTGITVEPQFHQMYLLAVDGLMHGYQGATANTRALPVSSEILRNKQLMDPETNKMLVSISADENLLATDPVLMNSRLGDLEDLIVGRRIYGPGREGPEQGSAKWWQRQRIERWHKEADAPRQVNKKMRGVRAGGQTFIGHTTTTSAFFRSMINLRAGNTLFSIPLAIAAPFEAFYRRNINAFANTATGTGSGVVSRTVTRLTEAFVDHSPEAVGKALGYEPLYTLDQKKQLNKMVRALSSRPEFKAMIYKELMFQYPTMPGIGRVEKWLERYAKFGSRMQDPAWGMLPKDLARIYVETVMRRVAFSTDTVISIDRLLTQLPRDPEWVTKVDHEAHNMAIAAVSQIRSLKPTPLSLAVRGVVDPLSENPSFSVNAFGNTLKVLTLFQNFWANFGTTITGLQGASDWVAFLLDGRQKKITARMQAFLRGEPFNENEAEFFDMSEVLESLDLADSFIRGGVTHTALFALGMLSGSLGLSGEDEETKFRRRQAELQGVPMLYDPRDIENDFRNKDSIFLDWLPFGMDSLFKVDPNDPNSRAMGQMNWIARTFLSPVIGMERFFNTGDFSEVVHGFKDAVGSHPIVNQQIYNSAMETSAYLQSQANDSAEKGELVESGHLLMTAVGVLEGMLFENSMLNMIYVGRDEWDRDPYTLPLTDSDGTPQRDIEGQVRPNDQALRPYLDDNGNVSIGYLDRSEAGADARVLTENRATMAFVASLFDGGIGESDFWRYNMPVKTREVEVPEIAQEEVEALIKAAAAYQWSLIDMPSITAEEAVTNVRNEMYQLGDATGQFFTDDQVWDAARQVAASKGSARMSILDDVGKEHLTREGARAVYEGLLRGAIEIGSPEMQGVYIPYEMREEIAAEWTAELIQEGLQLGLDETKARARMKRLMYGPLENPEVPGLYDLLRSQEIPADGTLTYGQLNTSYVMGPDGRPWASGFSRDGLFGALGLKLVKPLQAPIDGVTGVDGRGNTVDLVAGVNTGLRGLVPFDDTRYIPTEQEIGERIEKAIRDAAAQDFTPFAPFEKSSGSGGGWNYGGGWGYGGYGGYGGGGYSSGGGGAYFSKLYALPRAVSPYGNSIPFLNTSNPILRRAYIRRERVWSERGRLKQWQ